MRPFDFDAVTNWYVESDISKYAISAAYDHLSYKDGWKAFANVERLDDLEFSMYRFDIIQDYSGNRVGYENSPYEYISIVVFIKHSGKTIGFYKLVLNRTGEYLDEYVTDDDPFRKIQFESD